MTWLNRERLTVYPRIFLAFYILVGVALAWLGWEGYTTGWLPGERGFLCLGWLLPFITLAMSSMRCQIAPLILGVLMILVARRIKMRAGSVPEPINP